MYNYSVITALSKEKWEIVLHEKKMFLSEIVSKLILFLEYLEINWTVDIYEEGEFSCNF